MPLGSEQSREGRLAGARGAEEQPGPPGLIQRTRAVQQHATQLEETVRDDHPEKVFEHDAGKPIVVRQRRPEGGAQPRFHAELGEQAEPGRNNAPR